MNRIEWLDSCFALADISVKEYLRAKDIPLTEIKKPLMCRAKDAYEYLGISKKEFYKLKKDGQIPYVKGFGEDRYRFDLLNELVLSKTIKRESQCQTASNSK